MGSGSDEATTRGSWPSPEQALKTRRKQIDPEFGCWELRCRFRCMQPWGRRKAWGETGPVRQQHCCPASAAMHTPTTMCLSPAVGENRLKRSSRGFPSQATQQPNNPATQQPSNPATQQGASSRPPYHVRAAARRHLVAALSPCLCPVHLHHDHSISHANRRHGRTRQSTRATRPCCQSVLSVPSSKGRRSGCHFWKLRKMLRKRYARDAAISGTTAQVPGKCLGHGASLELAAAATATTPELGFEAISTIALEAAQTGLSAQIWRPHKPAPARPKPTLDARFFPNRPPQRFVRVKLHPCWPLCAVFGGPLSTRQATRRPSSRGRRTAQTGRRRDGERKSRSERDPKKKICQNLLVVVGIARQNPGRGGVSMAGRRETHERDSMAATAHGLSPIGQRLGEQRQIAARRQTFGFTETAQWYG